MQWINWRNEVYERVIDHRDAGDIDQWVKKKKKERGAVAPRGFIPVVVGECGERVLIPLRVLKEPCIIGLLDMAAMEYGYQSEGILRLPCDADHLRQLVNTSITKF